MKIKNIVIVALFVALLIAFQVALSWLNGIELITVMLASIAFYYGIKIVLSTVNIFLVVRSLIFGFFPSVMMLYFVYYNLFILCFGLIGKKAERKLSKRSYILSILMSVVMTIMFTALDNAITPLWYAFDWTATKAYWIFSLTAVVPQVICSLATMIIIFPILIKVYSITERVKR